MKFHKGNTLIASESAALKEWNKNRECDITATMNVIKILTESH